MPRAFSPKREREYKKIEHRFEKEGRYKGREEEVAARIVNKQRRKAGETKAQKKSSGKKKSSRKSSSGSRSRKTTSARSRSRSKSR